MARILLIDDEAPLRLMIAEILRRGGHEVHLATNGREGLKLAAESQFDLVITDIIMPEKEGVETIVDLRRQHPGLRIIAMSGGGRISASGYLELAQKLGAKATLAKPFSGTELLFAVDSVLSQ